MIFSDKSLNSNLKVELNEETRIKSDKMRISNIVNHLRTSLNYTPPDTNITYAQNSSELDTKATGNKNSTKNPTELKLKLNCVNYPKQRKNEVPIPQVPKHKVEGKNKYCQKDREKIGQPVRRPNLANGIKFQEMGKKDTPTYLIQMMEEE